MDTLSAARAQMELSLGFHMLFSAVGIAMPLMMLLVEWRWLRHGDADALALARTWGKATAVLFVIGAVSGTALSFELGLLWPRFMTFAGPLVGLAFALEGYAFFIEAIFLGLYLYGWERLSPRAHWLCGWPVAISGAASGILVLAANSWMQSPTGFTVGTDGLPANVDPLAALFNPAWGVMATHSTLATYQAVGFAAAGVYAWALLRGRRPDRARYNRMALVTAMAVGMLTALAQPLVGDVLARRAHVAQPAKLAALEGQFQTERGAPLRIGGWPDPETRQTRWALEIPRMLSFLAAHDFDAEVVGLEDFPRDQWPESRVVHPAFQLMVGTGTAMAGLGALFWWYWWRGWHGWRGRRVDWALDRRLLWLLVLGSPMGFLALEAGWVVTEAGRQPWVIYGVMRTRDAVTPASEVALSFYGFSLIYLGLAVTLLFFLRRLAGGASEPGR